MCAERPPPACIQSPEYSLGVFLYKEPEIMRIFRKGEHKSVSAYAVEAACDKNGWILGHTIHPGNRETAYFPIYYLEIQVKLKIDNRL